MNAGMPMGGAGAPGAQNNEEDKEHRLGSYLEGDETLFSPEQPVAPPVIGDWTNKDWK